MARGRGRTHTSGGTLLREGSRGFEARQTAGGPARGVGRAPAGRGGPEAIFGRSAFASASAMRFSSEDYDLEDLKEAMTHIGHRIAEEGLEQGGDAADAARTRADAFLAAVNKAKTKEALERLWDDMPEEEQPAAIDPRTRAGRRHSARVLGIPIPDKDPYFEWATRHKNYNQILRNALDTGRRGIIAYGPPGGGKNAYMEQVASALAMPYFEIDMSQSDEIDELIGRTGLRDGNTVAEPGLITRAACAKGGAFIVLNEAVETPRGQMTALHNLVGSGFDPDKRYLTVKSSSGEVFRYKVDPDTIIAFTYNPDRSDRRMHQALSERCVAMAFEYGSEEEEAKRVATRVAASIGPIMGWDLDPELRDEKGEQVGVDKQLPALVEECLKDVRCFRRLRTMYHEDALEHYPGTRALVAFTAQRLLEQKPPDSDEVDDSVTLAAMTLDFLFHQGSDPADRWESLVRVFADQYEEIEDTRGV